MEEKNAIVALTNGERLEVQESVEAIKQLVANAPGHDPLFLAVTDLQGKRHMVNIRAVADFYEPPES